MSLIERIDQLNKESILQQEKQDKDIQDRIKSQEAETQRILSGMGIKEFFGEIKDEFWKCGETIIQTQTFFVEAEDADKNLLWGSNKKIPTVPQTTTTIKLISPSWFSVKYYPDHYETQYHGGDDYTGEKVLTEPAHYAVLEDFEVINLEIETERKINPRKIFHIHCEKHSGLRGDQFQSFIIDSQKPDELEDIKSNIQNWFLLNSCSKIKNGGMYPLSDFIEKTNTNTTQEIILKNIPPKYRHNPENSLKNPLK